jgi:hypothetical protein
LGEERKLSHTRHDCCIRDAIGDDDNYQGARGQALGHAAPKAKRFEEFGCATFHKVNPVKMELTLVGAKLAHLHLGYVEVEKLVAGSPASKR